MSFNKKGEKYLSAKESLPKNLHPIYDQFIEEYVFHTKKRYGRGYVAYSVLADLVKDGWRPPEKAE
jgi:hypothetical protein